MMELDIPDYKVTSIYVLAALANVIAWIFFQSLCYDYWKTIWDHQCYKKGWMIKLFYILRKI
jgi:hypothetical protein